MPRGNIRRIASASRDRSRTSATCSGPLHGSGPRAPSSTPVRGRCGTRRKTSSTSSPARRNTFRRTASGLRTYRPRAGNNLPLGPKADVNLREGRMEPGCQLLPRLAVVFQLPERELDVLARAQRVDREIGARAVVVAQSRTADRHPVGPLCLGIGHLKFGEDRLPADVLDLELLFPAELPPQRHLPCLDRHLFRLAKPGQFLDGPGFCPRFGFGLPPSDDGFPSCLDRDKGPGLDATTRSVPGMGLLLTVCGILPNYRIVGRLTSRQGGNLWLSANFVVRASRLHLYIHNILCSRDGRTTSLPKPGGEPNLLLPGVTCRSWSS